MARNLNNPDGLNNYTTNNYLPTAYHLGDATLAWVTLLTIYHSGSAVYRLTDHQTAITDAATGITYAASPFELAAISETMEGGLPTARLTLYDPTVAFRSNLNNWDGMTGDRVEITRASYTDDTSTLSAVYTQRFSIRETIYSSDRFTLTFTLGAVDPLTSRFPRDTYHPAVCRHKFRGAICGYTLGDITTTLCQFGHRDNDADFILLLPYAAFTDFDDEQEITVSGSTYNDGRYVIDSVVNVDVPNAEYATEGTYFLLKDRYTLVNENSGYTQEITITARCNHTLAACKAFNNADAFGASPGAIAGVR